jgi:hypothetical protein
VNPTQEDIDRWAQHGFTMETGSIYHETGREILADVMRGASEALGVATIANGSCEIRDGSAPGCFDVGVWTGTAWKIVAKDVTKRTAENIIAARKLATNIDDENPIKNNVLKKMRQVLKSVRTEVGVLRESIIEREQGEVKKDAELFICDICTSLAQILDYFNE